MSRTFDAVVPEYEVILYTGPLPVLASEPSLAERDFVDMQSNPKRSKERAAWSRDALAAGMRRLGLKPRRVS